MIESGEGLLTGWNLAIGTMTKDPCGEPVSARVVCFHERGSHIGSRVYVTASERYHGVRKESLRLFLIGL